MIYELMWKSFEEAAIPCIHQPVDSPRMIEIVLTRM